MADRGSGPGARTLDMLSRVSNSTRLILLSLGLMVAMTGSSLYLQRTLGQASHETAEAQRLTGLLDLLDDVRETFIALRHWQTDLAVSLLTVAETNAAEARARLASGLDRLAETLPAEAEVMRKAAARFDATAQKAVEAYTDDQRVIGISFFAEARRESQEMDRILAETDQRLRAQADKAHADVLESFTAGEGSRSGRRSAPSCPEASLPSWRWSPFRGRCASWSRPSMRSSAGRKIRSCPGPPMTRSAR